MKLSDYKTSGRVKVMVYGAPKSGKTALVGKLASDFNLLWFDLEGGIRTLLNPSILDPKHLANIELVTIPDHANYPIAIETIRDVFRGGPKKICHTHGKHNCPVCAKTPGASVTEVDISKLGSNDIIVIDSLSQLSKSAMNRATLKERQKPDGESYKPTYGDYAQQGNLLEGILSLIQVLDMNVVIISHELESESLEGREKIVPISGTRNQSLTCSKYFDSVIYCTVLNKQHRAFGSSTYSPTIVTGSRLPIDIDNGKEGTVSLLPLFKR